MIIKTDSRSWDATRYATVRVVEPVIDAAPRYVAILKDRYRKDVAEWRNLPSHGVAERFCRAWVVDARILNDPPPDWTRGDAMVAAS